TCFFLPDIILFILGLVDLALGGLISNGFILTVILREWNKSRSLASIEQLILSLVLISEIFLLPGLYLLIVNSTHFLFLWCKLRILWLIPRFLAGSLFCSFLFSLFVLQITSRQAKSNITVNITNTTEVKSLKHTVNTFEAFFLAVGSGCPLLVVLLCSILVVASLCRHVCRIAGKDSHGRNLQTEAHIKAAWTVLSLLLLYVSYYAAQTLSIVVTLGKDDGTLVAMVRMVYPSAQASILMLVNPKLKQAAMQMLQRAKSSRRHKTKFHISPLI
uniref:Taste receptor type 2 n=1 Tax=Anolis carolinensis TaxID=28377 RepID=A0A803TUE9_ANOCA